jgi:hypothetical protein
VWKEHCCLQKDCFHRPPRHPLLVPQAAIVGLALVAGQGGFQMLGSKDLGSVPQVAEPPHFLCLCRSRLEMSDYTVSSGSGEVTSIEMGLVSHFIIGITVFIDSIVQLFESHQGSN